jgi:hypothetical protein
MTIRAGDIGEEDEETIVFEPLEHPDGIPAPAEPAVPVTVPAREPVPA